MAKEEEVKSSEIDLDKIFCINSKKYNLEKLFLKAVATVESALNPRAYRFEPAFWERYLKDNPKWKDKDPKVVSASYGIMQIMFVVAAELGFAGEAEDLYNPVINIEIGARFISQHLKKIREAGLDVKHKLWPLLIASARYNGGKTGNPDEAGNLRNQGYVDKVFKAWYELMTREKECE